MTIPQLRTSIHSFIRLNSSGVINPLIQEHLANSYTKLITDLLAKFKDGQRKHGGDIRDRNLKLEFYMEQLDGIHYMLAQDWDDSRLGAIDSKMNPIDKGLIS